MPSNEPTVMLSEARDEANGSSDVKPEAIQFCVSWDKIFTSPTALLKRTLEYAQDPRGYLERKLGADQFAKSHSLMCLPSEIDRDIYGSGTHKANFEKRIANVLGKKHGLFFITGTQAQAVAMRIYCDRASKQRVSWHMTSHVESAEQQAYKHLYHLDRMLLGKNPKANPTVAEIVEVLSLPADQRPAAILLEIPNRTLGGSTYTFDELTKISAECRKADVKLHCDGARVWEIEPYYQATAGKTFHDLGPLFDSVYVSFYKGLGGAAGAILASDSADFIDEAKVWQRRAGGNVITMFFEVMDDERAFNETMGSFASKRDKMIDVARNVTKATAKFKCESGQQIVSFVPELPTCCQTHTRFTGFTADELYAARDKVCEKRRMRVFEKLEPKQSVDERMFPQRAASPAGTGEVQAPSVQHDDKTHLMEWKIMDVNKEISTKTFVDGYVALCEELLA